MGLGMGETTVILLVMTGTIGVIFAAFYSLAKRLTLIDGKTCPHCAEKIKGDAKVCRYCHRELTGI